MMMKILCRLFALVLIYSCSKNETSVGIVQFELKTELWPEEGGATVSYTHLTLPTKA